MKQVCPYCGEPLPEGADFCPACARVLSRRDMPEPPVPGRVRLRRRLAFLVVAGLVCVLAAGLALWFAPKVIDNGTAGAQYTGPGGDWQLCIAWANEPGKPVDRRYTTSEMDFQTRFPVLLYVLDAETGENAADAFWSQAESVTAEFLEGEDKEVTITCTRPERMTDYVPDAAAITFVDLMIRQPGDYSRMLVLTARMKNGDQIVLRQEQCLSSPVVHRYTPADAAMDTIEELQSFLDRLSRNLPKEDVVYVQLPAVVYDGPLTLEWREMNLLGSVDNTGKRTTFTGTVTIGRETRGITNLENIDFAGSGQGTGVVCASNVFLENCYVAGWETGVLAEDGAWVNFDESILEDNGVAFCFDAAKGSATDTMYSNNVFQNNGTAVLLKRLPMELSLKFPGSVFRGNGEDIDNRCGQALDLDQVCFE